MLRKWVPGKTWRHKFDRQHSLGKPAMVVYACNLTVEAGGFLKLTSQPNKSVSSTFSKRMKNTLNVDLWPPRACLYTYAPCEHAYTDTQTHRETQKERECSPSILWPSSREHDYGFAADGIGTENSLGSVKGTAILVPFPLYLEPQFLFNVNIALLLDCTTQDTRLWVPTETLVHKKDHRFHLCSVVFVCDLGWVILPDLLLYLKIPFCSWQCWGAQICVF